MKEQQRHINREEIVEAIQKMKIGKTIGKGGTAPDD